MRVKELVGWVSTSGMAFMLPAIPGLFSHMRHLNLKTWKGKASYQEKNPCLCLNAAAELLAIFPVLY